MHELQGLRPFLWDGRKLEICLILFDAIINIIDEYRVLVMMDALLLIHRIAIVAHQHITLIVHSASDSIRRNKSSPA